MSLAPHLPEFLHEEVTSVTFGLRSVVVICETRQKKGETKLAEFSADLEMETAVSRRSEKNNVWQVVGSGFLASATSTACQEQIRYSLPGYFAFSSTLKNQTSFLLTFGFSRGKNPRCKRGIPRHC